MSDAESTKSKGRLRIGFVHRFDARSVKSWSGIFFFMCKALDAHVGEVVYLGPDSSGGTRFIVDTIARINRFWVWLTGESFAVDHNRLLSNRLGRFFERRLKEAPCDVLFAPVGSVEIAHLKTNLPIVYLSDITWRQIVNYYPESTSISRFGNREAELIEAAAIRRANATVYPSNWALRSAIENYGASPTTTSFVRFGANISEPPTREVALSRTLSTPVKLLLVGVSWQRKGGAIALECLISLLERGVDAELTICGCLPPEGVTHPRMTVIRSLDKNKPEQRAQLSRLFLDAHFMVLPTRAEAMGVVTCEASAHGLPSLVTDTGGTQGALRPGVNGFLLPYDANGSAYADKIISVIGDPAQYRALVISSRDEYEKHLNWDAWGRAMRPVFEQVLNRKIEPPVGDEFSGMMTSSALPDTLAAELPDSLVAEVTHP